MINKSQLFSAKPGVTFVELILFIGLMGMMSATVIPMLMNSSESRMRQDAIALVEQNGAQVIQSIMQEVRMAEKILYPTVGSGGHVLALQTGDSDTNPTLIGMDNGKIIMTKGKDRRILTSELVGVTSFDVDNTSSSEDTSSAVIVFNIRRIIRLNNPLVYDARFDIVANTSPVNSFADTTCDCIDPYCDATGSGVMVWEMCQNTASGSVCIPQGAFDCLDPYQ